MSLLRLIDEAEATGKGKAIFDDIRATKASSAPPTSGVRSTCAFTEANAPTEHIKINRTPEHTEQDLRDRLRRHPLQHTRERNRLTDVM